MTNRSSRGSDKPVISRCALTQHKCWGPDPRTSSRPAVMRPHHKAEHMAAHDQTVKTPKTLLPRRRRPHTTYRKFAALKAESPGSLQGLGCGRYLTPDLHRARSLSPRRPSRCACLKPASIHARATMAQVLPQLLLECFADNETPRPRRVVNPQPGRLPRFGAMEPDRADTQHARCRHHGTAKVKIP